MIPFRFRRLSLVAAIVLAAGPAVAGEVGEDRYAGTRYGPLEIEMAPGQWQAVDREGEGGNEAGGPVVELKSLRPVAGLHPVVLLSAFRKDDPAVTSDALLRASRAALTQRGADCGPVLARQLAGRKVRYFEAGVAQHGRPARLYYVLLDGDAAFYAAQAVAPEAAFAAVRQQVDELLPRIRY